MTTRTGGASRARERLSPVDGMAQLSFVIQGMLERRAAEHDLSVIQTRLLGILRDRTPTMNELARFLGLDKSSVTGLVDRAERRGLVARAPSTTDRRAVLVSLTEDGRSLVSEAAARFETDVSALLSRLPPIMDVELDQFIQEQETLLFRCVGQEIFNTRPFADRLRVDPGLFKAVANLIDTFQHRRRRGFTPGMGRITHGALHQ